MILAGACLSSSEPLSQPPLSEGLFAPVSEMDFKIGAKVRFIERHTPPGVEPNAVGVIVSIEHDTEPWEPGPRSF